MIEIFLALSFIAINATASPTVASAAALTWNEPAASPHLYDSVASLTPPWPCPADFDVNGFVNDADFAAFVAAYEILDCSNPAMPAGCPADFNGNAFVEDSDFVIFVVAYAKLICQTPGGGEMP